MSREESIRAALADANRTLSKANTGSGHYMVTRMDVLWLKYDSDKDGMVPAEGPVITIVPTTLAPDGTLA